MAQLSIKYLHTVCQFVDNAPQSSELSAQEFLDRPLPNKFRPLCFTNENQVALLDIEHMLEGHISSLYSVDYLFGIKRFFLYLFPRMRLYEYVIQICRCAEEHYLDNNKFMSEKIEKLNRLVESYDTLEYGTSEMATPDVELEPIFSTELEQWLCESGPILAKFQKLSKILREIAQMFKIPRVTDRFPLRFMLNYVFVLVSSRVELLEQLEQCARKLIQLEKLTTDAKCDDKSQSTTATDQGETI